MLQTKINLFRIATLLGLIQGLIITILFILCITSYFESKHTTFSYLDTVNQYLYQYYFCTNKLVYTNHVVSNDALDGLIWVSLIFHIIWTGISLNGFLSKNVTTLNIKIWSLSTLIVSIWDLILIIVLGLDYDKCLSDMTNSRLLIESEFLAGLQLHCTDSILVPLVIVAKGFIFWIINIALTGFFIVKYFKFNNKLKLNNK